jgi:hypothetical protein
MWGWSHRSSLNGSLDGNGARDTAKCRRCPVDSINNDIIRGQHDQQVWASPRVSKAIEKLLAEMRASPRSVRFSDALKAAEHFFGAPRTVGRHYVFKMPWPGDPRINLQRDGNAAKAYQVRQLLAAIDKLAGRAGAAGDE